MFSLKGMVMGRGHGPCRLLRRLWLLCRNWKTLGDSEQRNDMILSKFNKIILAAVLRMYCREAKWKTGDQLGRYGNNPSERWECLREGQQQLSRVKKNGGILNYFKLELTGFANRSEIQVSRQFLKYIYTLTQTFFLFPKWNNMFWLINTLWTFFYANKSLHYIKCCIKFHYIDLL